MNTSVSELALDWQAPSVGAILDFIYKSSVRMSMVLERQVPDVLDRIDRAIREDAKRFAHGGAYKMAWPALLAAAQKP